jgi:hypothetical protein
MPNEQTNTTNTQKQVLVLIYRPSAPRQVNDLAKALAVVQQHSTPETFAEIITPAMTLTFRGAVPITVKTLSTR